MKIVNHLLSDPKVRHGKSPNQGGTITPKIIVLHYTASGGADGQGDADYLSRAAARASAQIVVGRNGSIDQIIPFNKKAWHAGVSSYKGTKNVNDFSIGIEIDNWGYLTNGKSHAGVAVPPAMIYKGQRNGKGYSEWEAYPQAQQDATEAIIAAICATYKITDIVGHEDIAPGRKTDPGPALDAFKKKMKDKYLMDTNEEAKPVPATKSEDTGKASTKTTENLNLRERPGPNASVYTTIPKGRVVEVLDKNAAPGWDHVKFGERTGYVSNKYLS